MTAVQPAPIPKTIGPLLGPVGLAPRHHSCRIGRIIVDAAAAREVLAAGEKFRDLLPSGIRIIENLMRDDGSIRITFTKPSLREVRDGEPIPRYTLKESLDGGCYWWEEAAPCSTG